VGRLITTATHNIWEPLICRRRLVQHLPGILLPLLRYPRQADDIGGGDYAEPKTNRRLMVWGGSVAEWLACWTQAQKGPGSNRSRDAVG